MALYLSLSSPSIILPIVAFFICCGNSQGMGPCGESFCRFKLGSRLILRDTNRLNAENPHQTLGIPNTALGPVLALQRKGGRVLLISNATGGEPLVSPVFSGARFVKISNYKKFEAKPNFSKNQFKLVVSKDNGLPSIGRIKSRGNQEHLLHRLCVRLPIKSYDLVKNDGTLKKRIRTRSRKACVAFRSLVPTLLVDLQWNTTDDFDLTLREPNGFEINRFSTNDRSPNGGWYTTPDSGTFVCRIDLGIERIQYFQDVGTVESGEYTISVEHQRSCERNSQYRLRVLYDGNVILDRSDILNGEGEIIVEKFSIR